MVMIIRKGYRFEVFQRKGEKWDWRFRSANQQIQGSDHGQGFESPSAAIQAVCNFMTGILDAVVTAKLRVRGVRRVQYDLTANGWLGKLNVLKE
jgi:uncharacterized protein YegP (UPF0339 family)